MANASIRILVVDDIPESREGIKKLLAFESDIVFVGEASTGREGLEVALDTMPDVILMDINMPDMDGITATEHIGRELPATAIVMMSVHKDAAYLRRAMLAGARDFLEKPISGDELYATIRRVYDLNEPLRQQYTQSPVGKTKVDQPSIRQGLSKQNRRAGHIVAVYSPSGGVGKTTIAINMAAALMREDTRVLLVDCDLQFGDVETFLYLKANHTIANLAKDVEDLDVELADKILVTHGSGLKVLLAPQRTEEAEIITPLILGQVIEKLSVNFDYIILDLSVGLDEKNLKLFDIAHKIMMVTTPTLPNIRMLRRVLDIFNQLEYSQDKIICVLNRVLDTRENIAIPQEAIEKHLKAHIEIKIPSDEKTFLASINQGVPVIAKNRSKSPAKDLLDLADYVRHTFEEAKDGDLVEDHTPPSTSSRFGLLGRKRK